MREINMGGQVLRVRATALALLFYKQEFKRDLVGDLLEMASGLNGLQALVGDQNQLGRAAIDVSTVDFSKFDSVKLLQLVWAMAKADSFGKAFPSFYEWVGSFEEDFNLFDLDVLAAVMEEATTGFFRTSSKATKPKKGQRAKR